MERVLDNILNGISKKKERRPNWKSLAEMLYVSVTFYAFIEFNTRQGKSLEISFNLSSFMLMLWTLVMSGLNKDTLWINKLLSYIFLFCSGNYHLLMCV